MTELFDHRGGGVDFTDRCAMNPDRRFGGRQLKTQPLAQIDEAAVLAGAIDSVKQDGGQQGYGCQPVAPKSVILKALH